MPVSGKDVIAELKRQGWIVARVSGSHHQMRSPDGSMTVTVPYGTKDLKRGTLGAIVKRTGVEFE
jgi:predicted RNA binding protein YcfA (HicA-like mRNA interferase family)